MYLRPRCARLSADAVEEGPIRSNPAAGLRLLRPKTTEAETEEPTKALTETELQALIAATPKEWKPRSAARGDRTLHRGGPRARWETSTSAADA